jgi:hypothetical protein
MDKILKIFYNTEKVLENKDNNKNINWLNIILNTKFQNTVQLRTLVEVSMVSRIAREKLKPLVFKRIRIYADNILFKSNIFFYFY